MEKEAFGRFKTSEFLDFRTKAVFW